jgi:hypothetical protein
MDSWFNLGSASAVETSMRISFLNERNSGCDLYSANFETKKSFFDFFQLLKDAATSKKSEGFSKLVLYPLKTMVKGKRVEIKNEAEFLKQSPEFLTESIFSAILNQEMSEIFCDSKGVKIGNGEVWIQVDDQKRVGVRTINP